MCFTKTEYENIINKIKERCVLRKGRASKLIKKKSGGQRFDLIYLMNLCCFPKA